MSAQSAQWRLTMPLLWCALALSVPFAGLASLTPADYSFHDQYYVVIHPKFGLALAVVFGAFAVAYSWLDTPARAGYPRVLAWTHFALTALGVLLLVRPALISPLVVDSERYADVGAALQSWSVGQTVGQSLIAAGLFVFSAVLFHVLRARRRTA